MLFKYKMVVFFFFFFQAEDGIRDLTVTGVQTCALPICSSDSLLLKMRMTKELGFDYSPASVIMDFGCGSGNRDRKSTRLNSSHSQISYAVFCLKKKNKKNYIVIYNTKYKEFLT